MEANSQQIIWLLENVTQYRIAKKNWHIPREYIPAKKRKNQN